MIDPLLACSIAPRSATSSNSACRQLATHHRRVFPDSAVVLVNSGGRCRAPRRSRSRPAHRAGPPTPARTVLAVGHIPTVRYSSIDLWRHQARTFCYRLAVAALPSCSSSASMAATVRLSRMCWRIRSATPWASRSMIISIILRCSMKSRSRFSAPEGSIEPEPAVAVGFVPQAVEHVDHVVVVGGDVDGAVERGVGEEPLLAPGAGHRHEVFGGVLQDLDVCVGPPLGGEFRGGGVQGHPDLEQLTGLGGAQRCHPGVLVHVDVDQSFAAEPA